jgi:hypothetical protein
MTNFPQVQRRPNLGIWVIPGAISGGVLGLLLALWGVETVTSAPIPGSGGQIAASGRVFGLVVREEIGSFAQVRASVGQHMRLYAIGMIMWGWRADIWPHLACTPCSGGYRRAEVNCFGDLHQEPPP